VDVGVPIPRIPPLWRETRAGVEAAALFSSAIWRGGGIPDGGGRPVLLIPGFLAGDGSLATMTRWLRENGYRTRRAGIRVNVNCSEEACRQLVYRLEHMAETTGQRVAIIGQSRGGIFARALAVRRPDLVSGIVTLGSPTVRQLDAHPLVLAQVFLIGTLGTGRVPGMFSVRCLRGGCCAEFDEHLRAPFPPEVGFTALYSRTDGVVHWRACLDPAAEQIEVRASHVGMAVNAEVYAEIGHALATFEDGHRWAQAA
jgi:pimeloyl-ACP methyl ester carboxylesterase